MRKLPGHALLAATTILALAGVLAFASPAWAYRLYTDGVNGGNPKLAKKTYKVYIQANAANPKWRDQVIAALDKWKAELGPRGIDLQLQAGDPPQTPVDRAAFNAELAKYNADPNPDLSKYPEIAKAQAKQDSISIYWDTTENIQKQGTSDIAGGLANSYWSLDQNGHADTINTSDIFLPTDPKGGTVEVKNIQIHNIAMHELGHPAGFNHYTKSQSGQVMQTDATLFDAPISIQPGDVKGLDAIYGAKPKLDVKTNVEKKQTSELPPDLQDRIPTGVDEVWEYDYEMTWEGGAPVSYFQVETGSAIVYAAGGLDGLSNWLNEGPANGDRYFEFYADSAYLGDGFSVGTLTLYSPDAPGTGWLVDAGGAVRGSVPVPEPASVCLLGVGWLAFAMTRRGTRP